MNAAAGGIGDAGLMRAVMFALGLAACAENQPHGFHFEARFLPSAATILVDGEPGIGGIVEDFDTYGDALHQGSVTVTVMYGGSAADLTVGPGYCDQPGAVYSDIGQHWTERVELTPSARLTLDVGCLYCEGSKRIEVGCP